MSGVGSISGARSLPALEPETSASPAARANEPSQTRAADCGDPMIALAALLVRTDYLRSELDATNLRVAHETERRSLDAEVSSLHEAADHVRIGAIVQGGVSALGGLTTSVAGALTLVRPNAETCVLKVLGKSGEAFGTLAAPLGALTGEAPRLHAEADAKQAERAAALAREQADDARGHRDRVENGSNRALETIGAIVQGEHAGNVAVLSNVGSR